jgi:hypothetical protein
LKNELIYNIWNKNKRIPFTHSNESGLPWPSEFTKLKEGGRFTSREDTITTIVIRADSRVDLAKKLNFKSYKLTRVNMKKFKKIFEILIFHIKKLRNNPYEYRLDML